MKYLLTIFLLMSVNVFTDTKTITEADLERRVKVINNNLKYLEKTLFFYEEDNELVFCSSDKLGEAVSCANWVLANGIFKFANSNMNYLGTAKNSASLFTFYFVRR